MKKFYNEPEMNISLFAQENVATTASSGEGEPTGETAVAKAGAALEGATNTITLTW
ncbi:MAG: hypothetical protein ACI4EA_13155 [Candidatus Ornithomonoglobus sp.]